ncbi:MAG: DUF4443 domain-containing protein [Pyrobaculum sp.]
MKQREVAYLQLLAVLTISNTPRGRQNLANELRIGEGVVRALLEGGKDLGHVSVHKAGVKITDSGILFLKEALSICGILDVFAVDEAKKLLCGKRCMAHIIAGKIGNVLATRDALIRLGACGVMLLEKRGDRLLLPPSGEDLAAYSQQLVAILKDKVEEGGAAIVACGDTFSDALAVIQLKCAEAFKS